MSFDLDKIIQEKLKNLHPSYLFSGPKELPSKARRFFMKFPGGYDSFDIEERFYLKIGPKSAVLRALDYFSKLRKAPK